ncbi:hypothetical protein [Pseudosporangium ferrugineum]|uniref:Uncharacterized protein n=1 Tax=Pseudosporangium ferrugineum TaxID=439699 RepID=A0A2T0S9M9_9ACTN|nr:hypothetical protein [Pseudosporangium ferrugineum]PRY30118.1 hypothetical protein CLV70_105288 [Pseudosporangium ferrugineum]
MSIYVRWSDIRADLVEEVGGEDAVEAGKRELLDAVIDHRLTRRVTSPPPGPGGDG